MLREIRKRQDRRVWGRGESETNVVKINVEMKRGRSISKIRG